jgi:hypothetical protein
VACVLAAPKSTTIGCLADLGSETCRTGTHADGLGWKFL